MRAESKIDIGDKVRARLLADAGIAAAVDGKIFPLVADVNTDGDVIIYRRESMRVQRTAMGIASRTAELWLHVVSDDYGRGVDIAKKVEACLEGYWADTDTRLQEVDASESYVDGKFVQSLRFDVT